MSEKSGDQKGVNLLEPSEAARRLDMSGAGLRRLAGIYERVCGDLPRDSRSGRLWTEDALERLSRARSLVQAGRSPSVEAALVAEQSGEGVDPYPTPRSAAERLSASLIEEIRGLREAVERQNHLLEEQGKRLEALEALEAPSRTPPDDGSDGTGSPESDSEGDAKGQTGQMSGESQTGVQRPWWRRIFGGSGGNE